ncbi:hypothetical protein [Granulicella sp. dw_53]|uniref:hypothetical protein n=1 Tax=Granulicella sp. dw_53 TaxID=2719792 RepID=UPI001BD21F8B|nr:hypothetical protein [Granulicella sp. dw_53]
MIRSIWIVAAIICGISVLAICIAPLVDLPATSLRTDYLAYLAILLEGCFLMAISARNANLRKAATSFYPEPTLFHERRTAYLPAPLDVNNVLRR